MQKTVAPIKEAIKFGYLSVCSNSLCGFDYSLKMAIKKKTEKQQQLCFETRQNNRSVKKTRAIPGGENAIKNITL